jgi:hypothetical protein
VAHDDAPLIERGLRAAICKGPSQGGANGNRLALRHFCARTPLQAEPDAPAWRSGHADEREYDAPHAP